MERSINKTFQYLVFIIFITLVLTSCSLLANPTAPVTPPVTPKEVKKSQVPLSAEPVTPVPQPPAYVWPLTGMPSDTPDSNRPFMVMMNNAPQARPQSGLSYADVLFEILAEGEITRLVAVYQSKLWDGAIGPIRSIRPYYLDLGIMLDAIPFHAGGSPDAYTQLSKQKLEHMDEITNAGAYFWRDRTRKAPHNLYTSLEMMENGVKKRGIREQSKTVHTQMVMDAVEVANPSGERLTDVTITFMHNSSVVSYQYDPERKLYLRFVDNKPDIDASNNEQLTATNVVVIGADHTILDKEGRRDVKLVGSGKGYVFRRDKAQPISWERANVNDAFHLMQHKQEIGVYPGITHWLIVPNTPSFEDHVNISWTEKNIVAQ